MVAAISLPSGEHSGQYTAPEGCVAISLPCHDGARAATRRLLRLSSRPEPSATTNMSPHHVTIDRYSSTLFATVLTAPVWTLTTSSGIPSRVMSADRILGPGQKAIQRPSGD